MRDGELWTPEKRFLYLPPFPRELFIQEGEFLYNELVNNNLKVILIPAPEQKHADHKIRSASSHNPSWYFSVYNSHNRGKRKLLEKSLWRIVNSLDMNFNPKNNKYSYDTSFRQIIYSRFVDGYSTEEGLTVFPNNEVRYFFNLDKIELPDEKELTLSKKIYDDRVPF